MPAYDLEGAPPVYNPPQQPALATTSSRSSTSTAAPATRLEDARLGDETVERMAVPTLMYDPSASREIHIVTSRVESRRGSV